MPEGHTIHRLAAEFRARFAGRGVRVSSPQGKFGAAAALLDRSVLTDADAYGKHLFLHFGSGPGTRMVRVHLGLFGRLDFARTPNDDTVRLRINHRARIADLRGPTACELLEERASILSRLGPDPLRADADPDRAFQRIRRSRQPIAALLMDQKVIAGVGNVYRAEVLFRHRMSPEKSGQSVTRAEWELIWADLVGLMADGVRANRIDTVRPEHTPEAMGRPPRVDDHGGEVYVYRRAGLPCHVCGTEIRTTVLAARNLFWCPGCQGGLSSPPASPAR
ncbi:endonuclease VIII [Microtetraspora sp. NBRC 13810]|uniref:Fpg/Nei family DNA glycosylase n=1 Tax=Microtetraspora sp. NBRC 13810 TaxID=3030990 RepID=UPI0024A48956|nr:DNA-formamidopyrimidine glycosylase family protein [Microtetraspora sp. NBRC 13810]GLW11210.1 endonuclease VIII [Microtetraspora sp. NBRC 13810]